MGKQIVKALLCLLVGILCWMLALACSDSQNHLWQSDALRYQLPRTTTQTFSQMGVLRQLTEQDSQAQVTAFAQALSQRVSLADSSASMQTDVLYIDGDATLCWDLPILRGETIRSQTGGCVLDSKIAMQLFGSIDIVGISVIVGERQLQVSGVLALPNHLAAFGADTGHGMMLIPVRYAPQGTTIDGLVFMQDGISNAELQENARKWLTMAGMDSSGSFSDSSANESMMEWFAVLPVYLFLFFMLLDLFAKFRLQARVGFEKTHTNYSLWRIDGGSFFEAVIKPFLPCIGLIALFTAVLLLPRPAFRPPPSLLPTRWSDFSFWSKLLTALGNSYAQTRLEGLLLPDLWRSSYQTFHMLLILGSLAAIFATRRELHLQKRPLPFKYELLGCILLCIGYLLCIFVAAAQGLASQEFPYYLLFPIYYWFLMLCLRNAKGMCGLKYIHASREQNEKRFDYET
ncbi:MAG: ABC transporter permease [Clostridiales bacterium]|nr:ABC transporter permease [Clostridiales bacterium]